MADQEASDLKKRTKEEQRSHDVGSDVGSAMAAARDSLARSVREVATTGPLP